MFCYLNSFVSSLSVKLKETIVFIAVHLIANMLHCRVLQYWALCRVIMLVLRWHFRKRLRYISFEIYTPNDRPLSRDYMATLF